MRGSIEGRLCREHQDLQIRLMGWWDDLESSARKMFIELPPLLTEERKPDHGAAAF